MEEAFDPDGDALTYIFSWYRDDELVDGFTSATLPASETAKGETWMVEVAATDGKAEGFTVYGDEIQVVNTPPAVSLRFEPSAPTTSDDVTATPTFEDPDGDTVTASYQWFLNDKAVHDKKKLPASLTEAGDQWTVIATPNDGETEGEPVGATITIANTAPVITSVSLTPTTAYETTVLTVSQATTDPDEQSLSYTYNWRVNGSSVLSGGSDILVGSYFDKNDQVQVEVTANDGLTDSAIERSNIVTISNSVPLVNNVRISPVVAYTYSEALCLGNSTDADNDHPHANDQLVRQWQLERDNKYPRWHNKFRERRHSSRAPYVPTMGPISARIQAAQSLFETHFLV